MNIMFMGTPDFASYILEKLVKDGYSVTSVVTKIDAKKDRGQKIKFSSVKEKAIELGIKVFQPENLKEENFKEFLLSENPDMIVVAAYGKILPHYVIEYPKYHCINVHASILPKYRGSAPIQYAVMKGEKESGVTTMLMNDGLDTGDMLVVKKTPVTPEETGGSLHDKLMVLGYEALKETIENIESITPVKQNDSLMTYAPPIKKEETYLDFSADVNEILNKIRGFYPFPGTCFDYGNNFYKVHEAELYSTEDKGNYGEVLELSKDRLLISCKNGIINITQIQPKGKKKMSIKDFYNGNKSL